MKELEEFFSIHGWDIVFRKNFPGREGRFYNLGEEEEILDILKEKYPQGLYLHQKEALKEALKGKNICITTRAASGKSLVFYLVGLHHLLKDPQARILAIYPLKALGREQREKWERILQSAGLEKIQVGAIDGNVCVSEREDILRKSQICVCTPDIIHAWFLSSLDREVVRKFFSSLTLIVVDEVHEFSGVFGSNSAYLFRRLLHLVGLLGKRPQFICASATIKDAETHLRKLFGVPFKIIGEEYDTSPTYPIEFYMVRFSDKDFLSEICALLGYLAQETSSNFITFVDSRKQTEFITSILSRSEESEKGEEYVNYLYRNDVLPYRAGYEEEDRAEIQKRLNEGKLRGIVCTSALELGIDIPHLDICVLIGVPKTQTSFRQRIGRIGRHKPGTVIMIHSRDVFDTTIFRNPHEFLNRPLASSNLYLGNKRLQYIHALCLARLGGEHDQICKFRGLSQEPFKLFSEIDWPEGFKETCEMERRGEIPADLRNLKLEGGDDPNHVFPLRDIESQFKVEWKERGLMEETLGNLTYSQVIREAYPGVVYYYITRPYRVWKVSVYEKKVYVRKEKHYFTKPIILPTLVFPDFTEGNVFGVKKAGNLYLVECNIQVTEWISGYKERRGPTETPVSYPIEDYQQRIFYRKESFKRNYFTTGVVIYHPLISQVSEISKFIECFLEAYLAVVALERQDVDIASDKFRVNRGPFKEGRRFICLYDTVYGSLRLSSALLEEEVFREILQLLKEDVFPQTEYWFGDGEKLVETLLEELREGLISCDPFSIFEYEVSTQVNMGRVRIILPGSKGWMVSHNNLEFEILDVFYHPQLGVAYRGKRLKANGEKIEEKVKINDIVEIPGVSEMGWYDVDTGEIIRKD